MTFFMISRYAEDLVSDEDQLAGAVGGEVVNAKQLSDYLKHVEKETNRVITVFSTHIQSSHPVSSFGVYRGHPGDNGYRTCDAVAATKKYEKKHGKPLTDKAWTVDAGSGVMKVFKNRKCASRFLYSHLTVR